MRIFNQDITGTLYQGDCLDILRWLPSDSVDTLITDPPYGLSFMGKKWDYEVPSIDVWKECLRVLKPGATALIFAGSRTQHRMAVNVEDAGFILKDTIMWIYGSGFPKSTNISKQIDKANGKTKDDYIAFGKYLKSKRTYSKLDLGKKIIHWNSDREDVLIHSYEIGKILPTIKIYQKLKIVLNLGNRFDELIEREEAKREIIGKHIQPAKEIYQGGKLKQDVNITVPATNEAKTWNGWGTHLKPSYEPILVAMKPNDGTYAQNALKHGVAGFNIDGGRIEGGNWSRSTTPDIRSGNYGNSRGNEAKSRENTKGRFPANLILDEEAGRLLDKQSGILKCQGNKLGKSIQGKESGMFNTPGIVNDENNYKDKGGASRFFYRAKAPQSERNAGCEELLHFYRSKRKISKSVIEITIEQFNNLSLEFQNDFDPVKGNIHETVKPLKLMEYLCRLTATPTGGTVLDPFSGSGTTGLACINTDRKYILIEREAEYCRIAIERLRHAQIRKVFYGDYQVTERSR